MTEILVPANIILGSWPSREQISLNVIEILESGGKREIWETSKAIGQVTGLYNILEWLSIARVKPLQQKPSTRKGKKGFNSSLAKYQHRFIITKTWFSKQGPISLFFLKHVTYTFCLRITQQGQYFLMLFIQSLQVFLLNCIF